VGATLWEAASSKVCAGKAVTKAVNAKTPAGSSYRLQGERVVELVVLHVEVAVAPLRAFGADDPVVVAVFVPVLRRESGHGS
jgi:hypothetical protein